MKELYKELLERQEVLEKEDYTQQGIGRQKELNLMIVRVQQLLLPVVSNLLCGSFQLDPTTSSATKCLCGREKWEHPKAT